MRLDERLSPVFKIFLLLSLVLLLNLSPVSTGVEDGLRQARVAQGNNFPLAVAENLRQSVSREPWRIDLWEEIGRAEVAAGRNAQALEALQKAVQHNAITPDGRFLLGEIFLQQGDEVSADAAWLAVTGFACEDSTGRADDGLLAKAYERRAMLRAEQGDYTGAVEMLRSWNSSQAANARSNYLLGLYLSITTPEDAEPFLIEAARQDAAYSDSVQSLRGGLALYANSDQPAYGWLMIGRSLAAVEQWSLAEQAFRHSVETAPDYAEAWAFLSEARTHTGGSGQPEMERALSLSPGSTVVNALNALALRRQALYLEALESLQAVARQEPDEPFWLVEIANTYVAQGDLMSARSYFEQAATLAPANSAYWQALAMFSVDYNVDIRGLGLPAARQAVMLAPEDPAALDVMGWALANLDDSATGERFLQQALEADPTYAPASLHLAQIYLQRQQSGEAYLYLKQAVDVSGSDGAAESAAVESARRLLSRYFDEN